MWKNGRWLFDDDSVVCPTPAPKSFREETSL